MLPNYIYGYMLTLCYNNLSTFILLNFNITYLSLFKMVCYFYRYFYNKKIYVWYSLFLLVIMMQSSLLEKKYI